MFREFTIQESVIRNSFVLWLDRGAGIASAAKLALNEFTTPGQVDPEFVHHLSGGSVQAQGNEFVIAPALIRPTITFTKPRLVEPTRPTITFTKA